MKRGEREKEGEKGRKRERMRVRQKAGESERGVRGVRKR